LFDGLLIAAVGGVVLPVIVIEEEAWQPFAPVSVAVYVPGTVTAAVALFPKPFDHTTLPVPNACRLMDVVAQVITLVPLKLVIETLGGVLF
jgi:hypothetical protein